MLAFLLLLLAPSPASAGSTPSLEEEASLRSESEKVRGDQERAIRGDDKRLAEIYARGGGGDEGKRAGQITQDRLAAARSTLKGGGKSQILIQMAEAADRDASALTELYRAQTEHVEGALREWAEGPERKALPEALRRLQSDTERIRADLTRATEAAEALPTRLPQSGVLEKLAQIEVAAREASERLSARWELERAARERERGQREREAGERAREQRR